MPATKKPRKRHVPRFAIAPKGLRPKLDRDTLTTVGLIHAQNLDDIATGKGDAQTMWDMAEAVFTWSRVAEVMQVGVPEMQDQLLLSARVCERYRDTGKVVFTGPEYQLAKLGVQIMDQLAEEADLPTATEAALWSTAQLARLTARERKAA
jgi:hypothetical protein